MATTSYDLWTFQDVVEQLLDSVVAGDSSDRSVRSAVRATLEAYREVVARHRWKVYNRRLLFKTEAPQSSSTITYDHTGGTYERMVTIASGSWPSNAKFFELLIDGVRYEIDDRKSSTVLTLDADSNPGADLAAGTAYLLYRDLYPLPDNFAKFAGDLTDLTDDYTLDPVDENDVLNEALSFDTTDRPRLYCVTRSNEYRSGLAVRLSPPPNSARSMTAPYIAKPRRLLTREYATGTVTVSSGSASVTGSGTAFSADHVGCVMRFSNSASQKPTTVIGSLLDGYTNPFRFARTIKSVESATALTLDDTAPEAISACRYTISDPIDLEAGAMLTYFQRLAEAKFSLIENREDSTKRMAIAEEAYKLAAYADIRQPLTGFIPPRETLADIADEVTPSP